MEDFRLTQVIQQMLLLLFEWEATQATMAI